jgi:hypothetical protein
MYQFDIKLQEDIDKFVPWSEFDQYLLGAIVKIVYSGTKKALSQVNESSVKNLLIGRLEVKELKITYQVTDKSKPRNENMNESRSDKALLEEYFKDNPNKEQIVKVGLELIKEANNV